MDRTKHPKKRNNNNAQCHVSQTARFSEPSLETTTHSNNQNCLDVSNNIVAAEETWETVTRNQVTTDLNWTSFLNAAVNMRETEILSQVMKELEKELEKN